MTSYLKSAIDELYGEDDRFVILGLTGRTGSGCSTVASILKSDKSAIQHSLFNGSTPHTNEDRKQKIIAKHFKHTWDELFVVIQASAVLTLLFARCNNEEISTFLDSITEESVKDKTLTRLELIRNKYEEIKKIEERSENQATDSSEVKNFYINFLTEESTNLKNDIGKAAFVKLYQEIGKNVRISGSPIITNDAMDGKTKFFTLAEEINEIIKKLRKSNSKTLIVIDAIRNPLEAIFFQERYAAFFLVAVSCPDDNRKGRLLNLGYGVNDIEELDKQEYGDKGMSDGEYSIQDIKSCLQRADLYISNPDGIDKISKFHNITNQILRFVSLIKHPGLVSPTASERCMQIAYTAKLNSGCISRQVGAVVTDVNFAIQSIGSMPLS